MNISPKFATTAVRASILTAVWSALIDVAAGDVGFCNGWYVGYCACVGVILNVASWAQPPIAKFSIVYVIDVVQVFWFVRRESEL